MRMFYSGVIIAALLASASQAHSATRAYVLNGLIAGNGLEQIGQRLRARGDIVVVGSYTRADEFAAEACAHRGDRLIVIGHSLGAEAAASVATQARSCGVRSVTMIGIDPPKSDAAVKGVGRAVNFVGALAGTISGARNVPTPGYGHMEIIERPEIQARILAAAE
jgi:hypothetical protein